MNHTRKEEILFGPPGYLTFRISSCIVGAFFMLSMSGCATILKGKHQTIPVASTPTNADIILDGNLQGQTPIDLEVRRKRDHLLTIEKDGFESKSIPITKKIGGAVWANILAGGLIGWGVDASTGAQYNLRPELINVKLVAISDQATADKDKKSGTEFIAKLNQLDTLMENKTVSKDGYLKERCNLFTEYFPDSPPDVSCGDVSEEVSEEVDEEVNE